jgi:hypothetical protein
VAFRVLGRKGDRASVDFASIIDGDRRIPSIAMALLTQLFPIGIGWTVLSALWFNLASALVGFVLLGLTSFCRARLVTVSAVDGNVIVRNLWRVHRFRESDVLSIEQRNVPNTKGLVRDVAVLRNGETVKIDASIR